MKARFSVGIAVALIALTMSLVAFAGTPGAVATQGQAIVAGTSNSETTYTNVYNASAGFEAASCGATTSQNGLVACGDVGLRGLGYSVGVAGVGDTDGVTGSGSTGVFGGGSTLGVYGNGGVTGVDGIGGSYGVYGTSSGGTGVYGQNTGSTGIGIQGVTGGVGSAVYGQATANGVGVFGDTVDGAGVTARTTGSGTALNVLGKARFSRSGLATVPSGAKKIVVSMSGVTTSSMVLATVQQSGAFWVKNVALASGSFTIFINQAPASPNTVKVAYFVLN